MESQTGVTVTGEPKGEVTWLLKTEGETKLSAEHDVMIVRTERETIFSMKPEGGMTATGGGSGIPNKARGRNNVQDSKEMKCLRQKQCLR